MAVPVHGLPFLLSDGLQVSMVPPDLKGLRTTRVVETNDGESGQLVSFVGVKSIDDASALVGKTLLARVDDLPEGFEMRDVDLLMGMEVEDESLGLLGCIRGVMRGPVNDVWEIEGPFGEVLLPAVEPIILGVDEDGVIHVDAPAGLVGE